MQKSVDKCVRFVYNIGCKVFCFTADIGLKGWCATEKDRVRISALLDLYGPALSDRRRDVLDLYYNDDLSLAEIAECTGITRQGVRDAIVKGEGELADLESKLGFFERSLRARAVAERIAEAAGKTGDSALCELSARLLSEL